MGLDWIESDEIERREFDGVYSTILHSTVLLSLLLFLW